MKFDILGCKVTNNLWKTKLNIEKVKNLAVY